jgi:hypothetical protein
MIDLNPNPRGIGKRRSGFFILKLSVICAKNGKIINPK